MVIQQHTQKIHSALSVIGVAAVLCTVSLWRLGGATFWDPDEAHYAQTTRELLRTGDWLAPYYNQQPFFDKPVFFHWLQGLAMAVFGETEFAARLVPAVAAMLLVAVTWWLGRRTSDSRTATVAALLLAASPGVFTLSRYAILDTVFTLWLFGGAALVTVAALGASRLQYPGYVAIGLATFTKGPVALALCGLAFLLASAVSADVRRKLFALRWAIGLLIAIAIASPWFIYMFWRFRDGFVQGYVLNENVLLFATPLYANQPPWWFYLGLIVLGMLPWTALLAGRLIDGLSSGRIRSDPFEVLLWSWVGAVVLFFSASHFKLDHYVFPAAPALCLICARAWTDVHQGARETRASRLGVRLIGPTLIVAALVVFFLLEQRLRLSQAALLVPVALAVAGAVATVRYPRPRHDSTGVPMPAVAVAALTALYAGALLWVIPPIEERKVIPDIARWVAARSSNGERVATFRLNRWNTAFRFYVDRHTQFVESDEEAGRFFSDPSPYFCVMTRPLYDALRRAGVPLQVAYSREGLWVTSGRALWRQDAERTEFIVAVRAR